MLYQLAAAFNRLLSPQMGSCENVKMSTLKSSSWNLHVDCDCCLLGESLMQVISLIPALLNSGILMVYKIGFTNELAKNSNSQMHLKRNRASSDNVRVICSSKKVKNTYGVHTQRETNVTMKSVMVIRISTKEGRCWYHKCANTYISC